MGTRTATISWRARLGEYARPRPAGTLGEIVELAGGDANRRYTGNLLDGALGTPAAGWL